jgi:hypothetical protein
MHWFWHWIMDWIWEGHAALMERINDMEFMISAGFIISGYGLYQDSVNPGGRLSRCLTLKVCPCFT